MNFEVEQSNQLFFNPRINESDKKILFELKNEFEKKYSDHGYFLIPSSGSSKSVKNSVKLIALKIEAVLNSAKRFNQFFDVKNPIWAWFFQSITSLGLLFMPVLFYQNLKSHNLIGR